MSKPVTEEQCGTYRKKCAEGRKVHIAWRCVLPVSIPICIALAVASLTASLGAITSSRDNADKAADKAVEAADKADEASCAVHDVVNQLDSHTQLQKADGVYLKETLQRFEATQKASDAKYEAGIRRIEDRIEQALHGDPS